MSVIKPALQRPELIAYFAGANNYCWLYFRNGEKKLLAKPISYLESQLPGFIRVHKTVLVNPAYVKSLDEPPHKKMAGKIHLDSGEVFPVSRRRWLQVVDLLQGRPAAMRDAEIRRELSASAGTSSEHPLQKVSAASILLVTDDTEQAVLTERVIRKKWPAYQFNDIRSSTLLPELLKQLPEQEYPTLILLDARTLTSERLNTLQRLKEDNQLSRIPVVLLILPTEQLVINGYQKQANSVISMPVESIPFEHTIERICQFWLHIVKLPDARRAAN